MWVSAHFQLYSNDRLEFCEFCEGKIKKVNDAVFLNTLLNK